MLKFVFGLHGPRDFQDLGPHLSIGPLVLLGFKFTEQNLIFCVLSIAFGVWYDDGDD